MNQPRESKHMVRHESAMQTMAVPENLDHLYDMVERAYKAGLVPSSYKSAEAAFLATLKGAEFGLLPQQSLQGFCVVNGAAHPWGTCLRGIVQASAVFEGEMDGCLEGLDEMEYMAKEPNEYKEGSLDHALFREVQRALRRRLARVKGKKLPDGLKLPNFYCGYSAVKRTGQEPACALFDTFDAHLAKLIDKSDTWTKFPTRMYMHRAASFIRRDKFSSVLIGLDMTAEEAMDALDVSFVEVTRPSAGTAPMVPMSTGQVLEHLATAGRPAPSTVREAVCAVPPPEQPKAPPPPPPPPPAAVPAPEAGYVPVGEPGAAEHEDKVATQVEPKAKGSAAQVLKASHERLKAMVQDKAQLDAIVREARVAAGVPDYVARMSNATDEQKVAVAEAIDEALARLAADRAGETQPGTDPDDPTNF